MPPAATVKEVLRVRGDGGFRISDGFISPVDLVEIGLLSAD